MRPVDHVRVRLDQPGGVFTFAHQNPFLSAVVSRAGAKRRWQVQILSGSFETGESTLDEFRLRSSALQRVEEVFASHDVTVVGKLSHAWREARLQK
jgi:hypothetical protein